MSKTIEQGGVRIEKQSAGDLLLVEGYGAGGFKLQDRRIKGAVLVTGTGFYPTQAQSVATITDVDLDQIAELPEKPELVLVGTGAKMQLLKSDIRTLADARGLALEPMDTGAAARTYNVLLMEGRRVVALLMPVD